MRKTIVLVVGAVLMLAGYHWLGHSIESAVRITASGWTRH